ncbi:MAG: class II aldolase/adducin family protein, partial [Desulfatitalea sp.]
ADGLVAGPGGNISARTGNIIYLSPSGLAFDELQPEDYVGIELSSGQVVEGRQRPTSEYLMHLACYQVRDDVRAVIHTHPRYTIAMSSADHDIKAMVADFHIYTHSTIPHLEYITVTTPELAEAVKSKVAGANALVLRNHGAVTLGSNLKEAYYRMLCLEEGAQIQWLATMVGTPRFLTPQQLQDLDALASEKYRRNLLSNTKQS